MSENLPERVTSDLDLLEVDLRINLADAEQEEDAFQRASEEELEDYVERLREIARVGEQALARGDS